MNEDYDKTITILVVEDEADIQELICYHLELEGFRTVRADRGDTALTMLKASTPDLMVLDLMLPGVNGLEVLKTARFSLGLTSMPIIIASARTEESDIITGLELGADDYLPKPFSPKVLSAKVKALLRRTKQDKKPEASGSDPLRTESGLCMDASRHVCQYRSKPIDLTATEFSILQLLASNIGRVFTRNQLISTVKGSDYPVTERSIDVQIASIRKKLESGGEAIRTVWGIGYKYQENEA